MLGLSSHAKRNLNVDPAVSMRFDVIHPVEYSPFVSSVEPWLTTMNMEDFGIIGE